MSTLISIITPTFNSVLFLDETIKSIIRQTYSNWELLVTDDCSTDDTWNILKEYVKKDPRIKIFRLAKLFRGRENGLHTQSTKISSGIRR